MDKNIKSALIVVGVAALAFLLLSGKKKPATQTISQQDKDILFDEAMGYRGGIEPPDDILKGYEIAKEAALKKIEELGLGAEFEAYKKIQDNAPPRP